MGDLGTNNIVYWVLGLLFGMYLATLDALKRELVLLGPDTRVGLPLLNVQVGFYWYWDFVLVVMVLTVLATVIYTMNELA